ncbi:MAG: heparinase II/III family protein [Pseudomonadota bacterium]|nr:heparinase II/III family protein [Pseudomonadota bacterium]
MFYNNIIYNFLLDRKSSSEISFIPENLWTGSPDNGKKIIDGFLSFYGEGVAFDKKVWRSNTASKSWNEELLSFEWVKDVRALGTNKARIFLRDNIREWMKFRNKWDSFSWRTDILSKRISFLMSNMSFFYNTADEDFQKKFTKLLNKQSLHLFKTFKKKNYEDKKIFVVKAIILASLCFKNLSGKFNMGINLLKQIIKSDILEDGMHYLRSPSEQFIFLQSLVDIKNFLGLSKITIPKFLNENIYKMSSVLKFFKIGNGELAIFNTYKFIDPDEINEVLKRSNSKIKIPETLKFSGFQRVNENRLNFLMDCGKPTPEKTHASSLSFEFSHGSEKIVVNCGSPFINNKKLSEALRSTAAHSTISIDDINSSDIFFEKNTTSRIANVWSEKLTDDHSCWINSAHSGYKDLFGLVHNRKIHIDTKNLIIRGQDYFSRPLNKHNQIPKKLFLRFHIHPDVKLSGTTSKKKVVLKLKNNLGWEFICSEPKIEINEGIYFGDKKINKKNNHILISENIVPEKKIKWLFRVIK